MKTKIFFKIIPYVVIVILLFIININRVDYDTDKVIVKKDSIYTPVKLDSIETKFDTIYVPTPIVKDSIIYKENKFNVELLEKYKASQNKLELYKEAIKNNSYIEVFEDSIQKVTVSSDVQGKLLKQSIKTVIKEREAPCYTKTIETTIIKQDRPKVFLGLDADVSFDRSIPTLTPSILYKTSNHTIYKVGFNANEIKLGIYINLW